jgi:hypothetical protein
MALPADQLRLPEYLRYRLALAVLPSLAWARGRFVARIVHRSPATWSAAVADLIRWHSTAKDEAAEWPGRAAQESAISAAGGDGGDSDSDSGDDSGYADEATGDETAGASGLGSGAAASTTIKPSGTAG